MFSRRKKTEPNMSLNFDEPLVKDMPYLTRADLCKSLNLESIVGQGDYKTLAGLMGMTTRDIQTISMSSDPADQLLSWWQPKISIATVAKLRELLLDPKMNREDLVKSLESPASTDEASISSECDVVESRSGDVPDSSSRKRLNPDDKSRDEEKKKGHLNETAEEANEPSTSSNVVRSGSGNVPDDLQLPEIVRISQRIASNWVDVAYTTGQFELHEINNVRYSRIDEDASTQARTMLELYITKNGSRRQLVNAIRGVVSEDLAHKVLSGHFIDTSSVVNDDSVAKESTELSDDRVLKRPPLEGIKFLLI